MANGQKREQIRRVMIVAAASLFAVLVVTDAHAITGGQPDGNGHPYAGMVFDIADDGGVAACSGVLVSPRVFVTAGHCTEVFLSPPPSFTVQVTFAPDATDLVSQVTGTPHTYPGFCGGCGGAWGRNLGDVGVIVLNRPVRMSQYGVLPDAGAVDGLPTGTPMTQVGYGLRSDVAGCAFFRCLPGDFGVRSMLQGTVLSGGPVSDVFLRTRGSGGSCFGDSGGPILSGDGPTVLAVDAYITDWSCAGVGYGTRLDRTPILSWIQSWM